MIKVVVPPAETVVGVNRFATPIARTFNRAVAGEVLVTPCCVPSALAGIRLVYVPCVFEVTLTVMIQLALGAMLPLFKVTAVPPLTAVTEAEPPQPVRFVAGGLARATFAGRLSVSVACVKLRPASLFVITMESWLICPAQIVLGLRLLLTEGVGLPATFSVALAGVVLVTFTPPPVDVNSPAGIVLILFPVLVDVTLTDTVHEPGFAPTWAGTVPPLKDKVIPPAVALTVPLQELDTPGELAMTRPD